MHGTTRYSLFIYINIDIVLEISRINKRRKIKKDSNMEQFNINSCKTFVDVIDKKISVK